jgi:nitrogen regulatory protein P-II 1
VACDIADLHVHGPIWKEDHNMLSLVTAVIKPHKLEDVKEALKAAGVTGMTVIEVRGFGRQGGKTESYRGSEYKTEFVPKVKVEVIVPSAQADNVVSLIASAAKTDKIGDGKIWTVDVGSLMRVRTGEMGEDAI